MASHYTRCELLKLMSRGIELRKSIENLDVAALDRGEHRKLAEDVTNLAVDYELLVKV